MLRLHARWRVLGPPLQPSGSPSGRVHRQGLSSEWAPCQGAAGVAAPTSARGAGLARACSGALGPPIAGVRNDPCRRRANGGWKLNVVHDGQVEQRRHREATQGVARRMCKELRGLEFDAQHLPPQPDKSKSTQASTPSLDGGGFTRRLMGQCCGEGQDA